ncbi:peptidase G1 [Boletus reticuloceps]|uniref:Peptidase G1 n=1 Tax=Boletus reticuloceps TaxID=495285 RepID=A0A8I3A7P5_9AGAM|nr:peptidase G1 [Boletus reticuloceps]
MRFNSVFISSFLLASVALTARPRSLRLNLVERPANDSSDGIEYGDNWAGAVWHQANGTFESVTGTVTVPDVWGPTNSSATVAVGIDGDTCPNFAMVQVGVKATVTSNGTNYQAWHSWSPADWVLVDIAIFARNVIKLTLTISDATSGFAIIENVSTGQSVRQQLQAGRSGYPLCQQNAEWLLEDFFLNYTQVPLSNFSMVTFTDAKAVGNDSRIYTPQGAIISDIKQDGQVLTSVSVNDSSVTINHV